mgnify:CR=1 FL=1|tara:strand:+ start:200 stop:424 length:225 start_codon:yes stop_codon:yes gene_type:complete
MKSILIFLILILLSNCSLNKDSKYWSDEEFTTSDDKKKLSIILEKSADITKMTIEEYEIYLDDYSKKSKYPDIN